MGTNFYWKYEANIIVNNVSIEIDDMDPKIHIGKRSAAGLYCWDCELTLCKGGNGLVHYSQSEWYDACPRCNQIAMREKTIREATAIELGFSTPQNLVKNGVRGCSSFSWAQDPQVVEQSCLKMSNKTIIKDEYGEEYTGSEFLQKIVKNCPIWFDHHFGEWFS